MTPFRRLILGVAQRRGLAGLVSTRPKDFKLQARSTTLPASVISCSNASPTLIGRSQAAERASAEAARLRQTSSGAHHAVEVDLSRCRACRESALFPLATSQRPKASMTTAAVQASTPAAPPRAELASSNPPTLVPGSAAFQRPLPAAIFGTSELFPAVLQPSSPITFEQTLDQLRSAAASGQIKALLKQHGGALLLRSFPIFTPDDFSEIAFACEVGTPHEEIGRPPKRTQFAPAVSSANEGPPEAELFMHSEYGWAIHHPAYLLFFSLVPAAEGSSASVGEISFGLVLTVLSTSQVEKHPWHLVSSCTLD